MFDWEKAIKTAKEEKIRTLEIKEKLRGKGLLNLAPETILEVDYDLGGFVYEIRVYSEYFEAHVPVSEKWLENNFPAKLLTIANAVEIAIEEAGETGKQYNNDDLNPPPSAA